MKFTLFFAVTFIITSYTNAHFCPCSDQSLCQPITKTYEKELVVFSGAKDDSWQKWNWDEITNVVYFGTWYSGDHVRLYCYAHERNVRVTHLVGLSKTLYPKLSSPVFRKHVLAGWLIPMLNYSLDGLNIDLEGHANTQDIVEGIHALVNETYIKVKSINKAHLVTQDIISRPNGYGYDVVKQVQCTDYFVVMDYDARYPSKFAGANSPYDRIAAFYHEYLNNLSIDPNHLVMAVPWYGYGFTCKTFVNSTGENLCFFTGKLASKGYGDIQKLYRKSNIGGLKWDKVAKSPYFSYKIDDVWHQFWFDNIESTALKYQLALSLNLRGLGMWTADFLDYSSSDITTIMQTKEMWLEINEYVFLLKL